MRGGDKKSGELTTLPLDAPLVLVAGRDGDPPTGPVGGVIDAVSRLPGVAGLGVEAERGPVVGVVSTGACGGGRVDEVDEVELLAGAAEGEGVVDDADRVRVQLDQLVGSVLAAARHGVDAHR